MPAERQQAQRTHRDAGQAQLDRQHQPALVADVLQQRSNTGQQYQHADLDRHVALGEPTLDRANAALDEVGQCRFGGNGGCTGAGGTGGGATGRGVSTAADTALRTGVGWGGGGAAAAGRNGGSAPATAETVPAQARLQPAGRRRGSHGGLQRGHTAAQAGNHHQRHHQQQRDGQQNQYHQGYECFHCMLPLQSRAPAAAVDRPMLRQGWPHKRRTPARPGSARDLRRPYLAATAGTCSSSPTRCRTR